MTEFDMAYQHNVAVKRKNRLIALMMLDRPIEPQNNDDSQTALRHFLRQYTYVDYTADDWLDRLLYALPLHGMLQNNHNSGDDVPLVQNMPIQ